MLPGVRQPLMRPVKRKSSIKQRSLLLALPVLALLVVLCWRRSTQQGQTSVLLDKLKQKGLAGWKISADNTATTGGSMQGRQQQTAATIGSMLPASPLPKESNTFSWVSMDHIAAAAQYLQEISRQQYQQPAASSKVATYLLGPEPHDMRVQHKKVSAYLASAAHSAKVAARKSAGTRGIIINAGGPELIASTIITLKVLREVHNCSLPIELVWHTADEMDSSTLAAMQSRWGPIIAVNLSNMTWPEHHRKLTPPRDPNLQHKFFGFVRKVMSLTVSSFVAALLLDADNIPLADPADLWDMPSSKAHGNLFWPDFWAEVDSEASEVVYDMVGLKYEQTKAILSAGKGKLQRTTESGQVLLDLVRHADVAEWALWINSFGDDVYRAMWGDKDTYSLSFAVAGKAQEFRQLQVPPGGAFVWRPDRLLVKATGAHQAGYQLAGMVQFDALGRPAFLHRTMNKFGWFGSKGEAWRIELMTGPLPRRWIQYYLSHESLGPTSGVPYDYVAPAGAFQAWHIPPPAMHLGPATAASAASANGGAGAATSEACPAPTFTTYWRLREYAVPVGASSQLDAACAPLLNRLLGHAAEAYATANVLNHPEALFTGLSMDQLDHVQMRSSDVNNPLIGTEEVPDSSPVVAWGLGFAVAGSGSGLAGEYAISATGAGIVTAISKVLDSSHAAHDWLKQHAVGFPVLGTGGRKQHNHSRNDVPVDTV